MFSFDVVRVSDNFISYFITLDQQPDTRYLVQLTGSGFSVDDDGVPVFPPLGMLDTAYLWVDVTVDGETALTRVYSNVDLSGLSGLGYHAPWVFTYIGFTSFVAALQGYQYGTVEPLSGNVIGTNGINFFAIAGGSSGTGGDQADILGIVGNKGGWLDGGGFIDLLFGGAGDDTIFGGNGDDRIVASDGNDRANGGRGEDSIDAGAGNDTIIGGADSDSLYGEGDDDLIRGGTHSDYLYGGEGDDRLWGDEGGDILWGEAGNDMLRGGDGRDVLIGGAGDNRLTGGADADLFVFSINHTDGRDVVMDFDPAVDRIGVNFNYNGGPDAAETYDIFLQTARQAGDHVTFAIGDGLVVLRNTILDDIGLDQFVDTSLVGGWYGWITG